MNVPLPLTNRNKKMKTMKTLKTYGVYGMVEKTLILHHRGVELKVTFTGGSANTNGIIPAKFTTDNPVYQYIIEHSKLFELKNIKLVRSVNVKEDGDDKPKEAPKPKGGQPAKPEPAVEEKAEGAEEAEVADGVKAETAHEVAEAADGVKEVSVTDLQSDARQYLIKECGLKARDVRSKDQITKAAADLGIRFVVR